MHLASVKMDLLSLHKDNIILINNGYRTKSYNKVTCQVSVLQGLACNATNSRVSERHFDGPSFPDSLAPIVPYSCVNYGSWT